ncbi:MAG: hypothetical protein M3Q07_08620 [Pseudobdellovibrionaceae bacterium]|nr:hypothetical protein [Pseudobdellovibrionaceae bacterium]
MQNDSRPSILYLTDLSFEAKGREYYKEDLFLSTQLRDKFQILLCHPCDSWKFELSVDLIVWRNTGPVLFYKEYFEEFLKRVKKNNIPTYNSMTGKADIKGKQYLADLTRQGYPVIPTVDENGDWRDLPGSASYMLKKIDGADSIGARTVTRDELTSCERLGYLVQPFVEIQYEVSFYFVNKEFHYALFAPDPKRRWHLEEYKASSEDLNFALQFIKWNAIEHGIQRVDACRLRSGELLLVEIEDLNPYLSLDRIKPDLLKQFVNSFISALNGVIAN